MPKLSSRQRGSALPAEGLFVLLSGSLLVAALLLGGATREGELWNAGVRLLSLPVLVLALYRLMLSPPDRQMVLPLGILAAVVAVPLVQLVPLPPVVWEHLPGRADFAETYRVARMAPPWLPLTLNSEGTLNAFLALLPAVAMFMAALTLDDQARRRLLFAIVVVAVAALVLGAAQLMKGEAAQLRLYETTNPSSAVGFFANRNHQAGFLLAALPVATAWAALSWKRWGADRSMAVILGVALFAALVAGAAMSKSRAGLLLAPPAVAACLLFLLRDTIFRATRRNLLLIVGAALVAAVGVGILAMTLMPADAVSAALSEDVRAKSLPAIVTATLQYFPFGSGLGTFEDIYKIQERPETIINAFLNHAHNDYIEIWLEAGLAGLILTGAFLFWYGSRTIRLWRDADGAVADTARVGTIVVGLLLAHSLVDYPLRTAALSTLFAMACGLLVSPIRTQNRSATTSGGGRHLPPRRFQLRGRR